jgi:hypothetical protein
MTESRWQRRREADERGPKDQKPTYTIERGSVEVKQLAKETTIQIYPESYLWETDFAISIGAAY